MGAGIRKLYIEKILPIAVLAIGIILLIYMITVEDEPGAIPLFLIVFGVGGYFYIQKKQLSKTQ